MAKIQEWLKVYKTQLLALGEGILLCVAIIAVFFYTPRPVLINMLNSTKNTTVTLAGKVSPNTGVAVFDKSGNSLVLVQSNDKGEFTLANVPIGEGRNELRLRAITSKWRISFARIIYIDKDTIAPALSINDISQATVTGSNTVLSGQAEPGSVVAVNGVKTTTNPDGTWTATVALQSGTNKVTVAATDEAGNTTSNTWTILYAPATSGSQTGTVALATSTVTTSAGSLPATTKVPNSVNPAAGTINTSTLGGTATQAQAGSNTTAAAPAPQPKPILAIVATAYVSNPSPNNRANETIYATVKDNYGNPVINATVRATAFYKSGPVSYVLSHVGNGLYSVSFKLNYRYSSNVRVAVEVAVVYQGLSTSASTAFTPI
jgi:hypothetical protein